MLKACVLSIVVLLSGCATILSGGPDAVSISTNPPGAAVFVDNMQVGQTPTVVTLDRSRSMGHIRIELPGFQPVVMQRSKSMNGWFIASICLGILPAIIDLITGDWQGFDDTPIAIGLAPLPGGYAPPPAAAPPAGPPAPPAPPTSAVPSQQPKTATLTVRRVPAH
jgi:uncharacterized protein YceK